MSEFPAISQLIPHSEPMVLLDRLVAWSPGHAECSVRVRADMRLVENGVLDTPFTVEHMAQTVAVCLGYEAYRGGRSARIGMVVSCRGFRVHESGAPVGSELLISASQLRANETTSHFACEVHCGGKRLASAVLTLFYGTLSAG